MTDTYDRLTPERRVAVDELVATFRRRTEENSLKAQLASEALAQMPREEFLRLTEDW